MVVIIRKKAANSLLFLLICSTSCDCQTVCKGSDMNACRCDLVDGKGVIDLSFGSKDPQQPLFTGIFSATVDVDTYSYNPCYGFESVTSGYSDLAVYDNTTGSDIGQQTDAKFIKTDNGDLSVVYQTTTGPYSSTVKLSCRENGENAVSIDVVNYNNGGASYNFTLTGPGACPKNSSSKSLSGGSIFLILLSVTIVVYLVGGVIYQKRKNDASGTDLIPNKDFWTSLPGLIKDGVVFIFYKCRGKSAPTYESV